MKVLSVNKKALFDYRIIKSYEAGLVLSGSEVKSIRNGQANLKGSYVSFKNGGEAYLLGAHISPYPFAPKNENYKSDRPRKILLHKKELNYLLGKKSEKGLTIIPIKLYTRNSFIKLEIALVMGKKTFDKREDLKKKDIERQLKTLTKKRIKE